MSEIMLRTQLPAHAVGSAASFSGVTTPLHSATYGASFVGYASTVDRSQLLNEIMLRTQLPAHAVGCAVSFGGLPAPPPSPTEGAFNVDHAFAFDEISTVDEVRLPPTIISLSFLHFCIFPYKENMR